MILGPDGKPIGQTGRPGADLLADVVDAPMKRDVSITRSFAFKLNLGNYESADFFCSQTVECEPESAAEASAMAHEFCTEEVGKAIADFKARQTRKQQARSAA